MTPERLAAYSRAWCTRAAVELVVAVPTTAAVVRGAFERPAQGELRRGSGGAAVRVGPGTVWVQLSLPSLDALGPCPPDAILNRQVRPLLRAVGATYFGRDWVSASRCPVGAVGFAHEARSGRTFFEAIVAVNEPFATTERRSFRGKQPTTLAEIKGHAIDPQDIARAIEAAYALPSAGVSTAPAPEPVEPPWTVFREDAIGRIAAGPDRDGRLRLGGEMMAASDVIEDLEREAATVPIDAVGDVVDRHAPRALLFGVRPTSILEVLTAARQNIA
jgi:hypothetical protein